MHDLPVRDLKDKCVLITGAGRGIGKRLALGFAQAGARVGLLARTQAQLDLAQLEIEHSGGLSMSLRADVRDYEQVLAAVQRMTVHFGPPQVLVCAAGVLGPIGALAQASPAAWREAVDTNLLGAFHACRAVLPGMRELRSGKLLLLADTGAEIGRPFFSAYAASKAALVRLAESLAEEVREDNIQVNCFNPGPAYTSLTDEILRAPGVSDHDRAEALQVRTTGGTAPDKQIQARFVSGLQPFQSHQRQADPHLRRLAPPRVLHALPRHLLAAPPHPLLAACPEATAAVPSYAPLVSEPRP